MSTTTEKLKVFIHTDFTLAKTGFGKNAKAIFEYLYSTNKYELINFAVGAIDSQIGDPKARTPWKTVASVNSGNLENIKRQNDPRQWENIERMAGYGAFELDEAVKTICKLRVSRQYRFLRVLVDALFKLRYLF